VSNLSGKAYGLTAITRMHPIKTLGVRAVFALIRVSMMRPPIRGFVGGVLAGVVVVILLGLLQLAGIHVGLVMPLGRLLLPPGFGAWVAGLLIVLVGLGAVFAAIGTVYQPKWTILGRITQVQVNLTQLSFIHFARWVIIERGAFPRLDATQPRESLHYDHFLFESNFNGDWEKYIGAFSQVVPGGMDNIWRWSVKYPKSRPITPFLNYIRNCQYDTDYYYSAYPGASTNDIRGALKLAADLPAFARRTAELSPLEFLAAYNRLLVQVQNCLATTGPPPMSVPSPSPSPSPFSGPTRSDDASVRLPAAAAVPRADRAGVVSAPHPTS
jgi:hypothetical protein